MSESFICRRGGSGGGLNFSVVGGTSAPSSPKENTIWVNSSDTFTDWVFSKNAPSAPTSNMIWFQTNNGSIIGFNAVKKNGIWLYPALCKQYVDGAWVDKTAKIYQNDAWQDWYLRVINGTDISVSGGWTATASGYTVKLTDAGLTISGTGGGLTGLVYPSAFDPDLLANFNTITMTYTLTRGNSTQKDNKLQVANNPSSSTATISAQTGMLDLADTPTTTMLDITNIDSGYIRFLCGQVSAFVISELRLS